MSFDISVAGNYGSGEAGELTVAANASKSDLNGYARVTGIDGKILTVESFSDAGKFTVGTWLFVHVAGYTGSGTFKYLGRWKISYIKAIDGNRLTMNKSFSGLAGGNANALIQAVTVPEFTKVTLKGTLTCPQFNTTNNYGGVVAFMCSEELIFDGGNINLNGKGLSSASLRPEFTFESYLDGSYNNVEKFNLNAKYTGFENYKLRTHMPLNYPDGAAFILAKKITCNENSRIGNPSKSGEARRPVQNASEKGGANILIAAEEIENFDENTLKMISKMPSVTSGGKGKGACYIATESLLPCDEGLYAYDRITTPTRLSEVFKIKDFGDGSSGTKTNYALQLNSYAKITGFVGKSRAVFTVGDLHNDGLAKIKANALVMIHTGRKAGGHFVHSGRFSLARILSVDSNQITIDTPLEDINNWVPRNYDFQMIAIPQFKNFTLTKSNTATPAYQSGYGGLCVIAVNDTCDLSGGKIIVNNDDNEIVSPTGKGLNSISNAQAAEKLRIGEGYGSVFILANNLVMNENTRLGADYTGKAYGGEINPCPDLMMLPNVSAKACGSAAGGGECKNSSTGYDLAGGYNSNAKWPAEGTTRNGKKQGAHILIVANKITNLSLAALSTGGEGGGKYEQTKTTAKDVFKAGANGGCGFGGAGGYFLVDSGTNNANAAQAYAGGAGGYIGGGAGRYEARAHIGGGGSGSFCFIYCNEFENQDTDYLSPD